MYPPKYGKRFSGLATDKEGDGIVISSIPVERISEGLTPKSPERTPLKMPPVPEGNFTSLSRDSPLKGTTCETEGGPQLRIGVKRANAYERRKYNRYFSRFSPQSPEATISPVPTTEPCSTRKERVSSSSSLELTKSDIKACLREVLTQDLEKILRDLLPDLFSDRSVQEASCECLSPPTEFRRASEFIPFFNDPENTTFRSKTTIDDNGYVRLAVGLAGRILHNAPRLYPFGYEKVDFDVGEHQIRMDFVSDQGKRGFIQGTWTKDERGFYVILLQECFREMESSEEESENVESIDFTEIDLPLHITFEGGFI